MPKSPYEVGFNAGSNDRSAGECIFAEDIARCPKEYKGADAIDWQNGYDAGFNAQATKPVKIAA